MMIYLRDLEISDAEISYIWRNNPNIWRLTGSKPDRYITLEIEHEWITNVLNRQDEKRYAICISGTDQYIGNIQLTHIDKGQAEFHIFIGEESFWGKGIGTQATRLLLDIAFNEIGLDSIYLFVNSNNIGAIKSYKRSGFEIITEEGNLIKMKAKKI